jgi:hypothetical protein
MIPAARVMSRQAAREMGRQAQVASRAAREAPVPTIVALATVALLARLLLSRR